MKFFFVFLFLSTIFDRIHLRAEESKPLVYGVSEPLLSLNPFSGTGFTMWQAHQLIFEFLLYETPGKRDFFQPYLAKKWTISKDKKTFEFELRESKWTDGKPVTAEDVKFSIEHIYEPRYKSIWVGSFQGIEKVEVINSRKIRIKVKEPQFELWKTIAVTLKIVPKHYYIDPESTLYAKNALGSGPYKIQSFESGSKFTLEKNQGWWGWRDPELKQWYTRDRIRFLKLGDSSIPAHFQKGEIDYLRVTDGHVVQSLKQSQLELDFVTNPNRNQKMIEQILFNLKNPLFSDPKIRKALNMAINTKPLCERSYPESLPAGQYNMKEALALLKKAGWVDHDKDGILDKSGQTFEFSIVYASKDFEVILTQLKEEFKTLGIKIDLEFVDYSMMQKTLKAEKFQSYIDRFDDHQTVLSMTWASDGTYNLTGFKNKDVDRGLRELQNIYDPEKREQKIKSLRKIISKNQPSLRLCEVRFPDFVINKKNTTARVRPGILQWGWF